MAFRYPIAFCSVVAALICAAVGLAERAPGGVPRFTIIPNWESRSQPPDASVEGAGGPMGYAVLSLAQYTGALSFTGGILSGNLSPLEWPPVFAGDRMSPRRLRAEAESRMAHAGVSFRELVVLERRAVRDSIMQVIAAGHPVLLNTPEAPVLYGYDSREPDLWWWVQMGPTREIVFESERTVRFVYWSDDPASNVMWEITGRDSIMRTPSREESGYEFLSVIDRSVRGDPAIGLRPYPLSIRAFRDSLTVTSQMPALASSAPATDPLGVRRVATQRARVTALLEGLALQVTDTSVSQPLRLALYYYHNGIQTLGRLDSALYQGGAEIALLDRCRENWGSELRRARAAAITGEFLDWERQAAEQIALALAARKPSPRR